MPWRMYVDQYNAAAKLAPKGVQKATVGFNDILKGHARARMAEVEDFAAIWTTICEYLPHDKHYNGSDMASRDDRFKKWKVTLAYLVSPSGFSAAADRAIVWQDEQAEKARQAAIRAEEDRLDYDRRLAEARERLALKAPEILDHDDPKVLDWNQKKAALMARLLDKMHIKEPPKTTAGVEAEIANLKREQGNG